MAFAISTHLFHGERLTRAHFETLAAHGFDEVEVFATRSHFDYADPRAVDLVRAWLDELGLRAVSLHGPICASFSAGLWGPAFSNASGDATARRRAVEETRAALAAARALDARRLVLHLGLPQGQPIAPGDNDAGAARRSLEELALAAATAGVQLALEVIPNPLSSPLAILEWIEDGLDQGDVGVCLDTGHAHLLGGAPDAIEVLSGHIVTTHLHDNRGTHDDHLVPLAGTLDWTTTLAALWKVGYTGPLVFEVADHGDAAAVLARTVSARDRLQAILDDLLAPFEFEDE